MSGSVNNNNMTSLYLTMVNQQIQKNTASTQTSQSDLLSSLTVKSKSAVDVQISKPSQFMQYANSLSETEKTELMTFMDQVRTSIESGSFDAEALAQNAPESLKKFAEQNGESVGDVLSDIEEHHDSMKTHMASLLGTGSDQSANSTTVSEFFSLIQQSLSSDEIDTNTLAKNEPEVLKHLRDKQGMSFEDMITKLKSSNLGSNETVSTLQNSLNLLVGTNNSETSSTIMNNILQYSMIG